MAVVAALAVVLALVQRWAPLEPAPPVVGSAALTSFRAQRTELAGAIGQLLAAVEKLGQTQAELGSRRGDLGATIARLEVRQRTAVGAGDTTETGALSTRIGDLREDLATVLRQATAAASELAVIQQQIEALQTRLSRVDREIRALSTSPAAG